MELMELFAILNHGEGPHTEFKIDFTKQAHDIAKEMVALANSGGGVLLMGVDDDGKPKGIPEPNRVVERLAGIARSCSPPLRPEIDKVQLGKDVFIVYAKVPASAPCLYQGKFFIRIGSTSVEASGGDEIKNLIGSVGVLSSRPVTVPSTFFYPPPIRGFKGRTEELKRLNSLMSNKTVSMIVIEGISGIGKTALTAHFAKAIEQQEYPPFWVDCREDTSFDSVTLALATFARNNNNDLLADLLENVNINLEDRLARIAAGIAECKYALFFDDYHLVTDPMINRLLQKVVERAICPKIFIICRRRPRLVAAISPLLLVEQTLRAGLDLISCVQFLIECGLDVSEDMAHKIWNLTGEGHPKALEIFIARSRTYPITELLSSLPVFREELRNEWLTPLMNELPQEQREVAIDLSVFDRPIPYQSMSWLYPGREVDPLVVGLVDRFILDRVGEDSLRMHVLIREFCYAQILDKRAKHTWIAEYYIDQRGSERNPEMISDAQTEAGIAAWSHLIKAEDHIRANEELNRIRAPLMNRGQYEQLMFLIEQTPISLENEDWYTIHKARILSLWESFDTAISIISHLVDSSLENIAREAILVLATILNDHNKAKMAKDLLEKHYDHFTNNSYPLIRRRFLSRLVETYSLLGELDQALNWASKVAESCESEGEDISGAVSLRQMAAVLQGQKRLDTALSLTQTSYDLLTKHQRIREAGITQRLMASIYKELGDYTSALQCLWDSLQVFAKMGDRKNSTICRQQIKEMQSMFGERPLKEAIRSELSV